MLALRPSPRTFSSPSSTTARPTQNCSNIRLLTIFEHYPGPPYKARSKKRFFSNNTAGLAHNKRETASVRRYHNRALQLRGDAPAAAPRSLKCRSNGDFSVPVSCSSAAGYAKIAPFPHDELWSYIAVSLLSLHVTRR